MKKFIFLTFLVVFGCSILSAQATVYKATLTWVDNSTDENGFVIERNNGNDSQGLPTPFISISQVGSNVVSYVDQPINAGETHCWRVSAFNAAGKSAPSPVACATAPIPVTIPNPPGTLQIIITIAN